MVWGPHKGYVIVVGLLHEIIDIKRGLTELSFFLWTNVTSSPPGACFQVGPVVTDFSIDMGIQCVPSFSAYTMMPLFCIIPFKEVVRI